MLGVGVFDGHSGQEASKYVAENLWNEVRNRGRATGGGGECKAATAALPKLDEGWRAGQPDRQTKCPCICPCIVRKPDKALRLQGDA